MNTLLILQEIWGVVGPELGKMAPDVQTFVKGELYVLAKATGQYLQDVVSGTPMNADERDVWIANWKDHFVKEVLPIAKGMGQEAIEIAAAKSVEIAGAIIGGVIKLKP